MWVLVVMLMRNNLMVVAECSFQWLISITGFGFRFGLRQGFLYYANTMGKGSESESKSVETCSAYYYIAIGFGIRI